MENDKDPYIVGGKHCAFSNKFLGRDVFCTTNPVPSINRFDCDQLILAQYQIFFWNAIFMSLPTYWNCDVKPKMQSEFLLRMNFCTMIGYTTSGVHVNLTCFLIFYLHTWKWIIHYMNYLIWQKFVVQNWRKFGC